MLHDFGKSLEGRGRGSTSMPWRKSGVGNGTREDGLGGVTRHVFCENGWLANGFTPESEPDLPALNDGYVVSKLAAQVEAKRVTRRAALRAGGNPRILALAYCRKGSPRRGPSHCMLCEPETAKPGVLSADVFRGKWK